MTEGDCVNHTGCHVCDGEEKIKFLLGVIKRLREDEESLKQEHRHDLDDKFVEGIKYAAWYCLVLEARFVYPCDKKIARWVGKDLEKESEHQEELLRRKMYEDEG